MIKLVATRVPKPNSFRWQYEVYTQEDGQGFHEYWGTYDNHMGGAMLRRIDAHGSTSGVTYLPRAQVDEVHR
jgi:hypothetical protein